MELENNIVQAVIQIKKDIIQVESACVLIAFTMIIQMNNVVYVIILGKLV